LTVTTTASGSLTAAGPITSPGFGRGTLTYLPTVNPDGTTTAPFVAKFKFGSLKGTTKGALTADPAGGNKLAGSGKITSGTRAYKDAKGSFTYTGHDHADGTDTLTLKGKVTFPTRCTGYVAPNAHARRRRGGAHSAGLRRARGGGRAREDHQLACGDDRARFRGELHRDVHVEQARQRHRHLRQQRDRRGDPQRLPGQAQGGHAEGHRDDNGHAGRHADRPDDLPGRGQGLGRHPLLPGREGHVRAGGRHDPGRHADAQARRHARAPRHDVGRANRLGPWPASHASWPSTPGGRGPTRSSLTRQAPSSAARHRRRPRGGPGAMKLDDATLRDLVDEKLPRARVRA